MTASHLPQAVRIFGAYRLWRDTAGQPFAYLMSFCSTGTPLVFLNSLFIWSSVKNDPRQRIATKSCNLSSTIRFPYGNESRQQNLRLQTCLWVSLNTPLTNQPANGTRPLNAFNICFDRQTTSKVIIKDVGTTFPGMLSRRRTCAQLTIPTLILTSILARC